MTNLFASVFFSSAVFMADLNKVKQSTLLYATDAQKSSLRNNLVRSSQKIILFCSAVGCVRRIKGRTVTSWL